MATRFNNRLTPSPGSEVKIDKWADARAADMANRSSEMDVIGERIAAQFMAIGLEPDNKLTGAYAASLQMDFDVKKRIHGDRFYYSDDEGRGVIEYGRTPWAVTAKDNKGKHPKSEKGRDGKFVFKELIRRARIM